MIIAIDFDGTIVTHKYPNIGNPVPNALESMTQWQQKGAKLILYTMRSGLELKEAVDYCECHGIYFWGVNMNPDQVEWTKSPKVYAQIYVDDAAFGCPLIHDDREPRPYVNWNKVGPDIARLLYREKTNGRSLL